MEPCRWRFESTASLVLPLAARQQADRKDSSKAHQNVVDDTKRMVGTKCITLKKNKKKKNSSQIKQGSFLVSCFQRTIAVTVDQSRLALMEHSHIVVVFFIFFPFVQSSADTTS